MQATGSEGGEIKGRREVTLYCLNVKALPCISYNQQEEQKMLPGSRLCVRIIYVLISGYMKSLMWNVRGLSKFPALC